jgi:hypothetical protein
MGVDPDLQFTIPLTTLLQHSRAPHHWMDKAGVLGVFLPPLLSPKPGVRWRGLVFWGKVYLADNSTIDRCPDHLYVLSVESRLPKLTENPVARRSGYLYGLEALLLRARNDPAVRTALEWERARWRALDEARLTRIWAQIEPTMFTEAERLQYRDEHWFWTGAYPQGLPACGFGGSKHVPVMRILWPIERPSEPLTLAGKLLRPRRDRRICPHILCVNPHHFEYAVPVRPARDPSAIPYGNASRTGALPAQNYHWSINSPSKPDPTGVFDRLVLCPSGHELGPTAQIKYNAALKGGSPVSDKGHCPTCYKLRMESGPQVYRRPYKGQPVDANLLQQAKDMFRDVPLGPGPTAPEPDPQPAPPDPFEEFSADHTPPGYKGVYGPFEAHEVEDLFAKLNDNDPA